jgi:hypothetical protein
MTKATQMLLSGIGLVGVFGYILLKAALTDSIWVRKMGKSNGGGWKLRYWQMPRKENPTAFWINIAAGSLFFCLGLFAVTWGLISSETVH